MKRTNRNKIVISTLLATVLIGAGVVKSSHDSNIYAESYAYNERADSLDNNAYLVTGEDGKSYKYFSMQNGMATEKLHQMLPETKGISDNWFEYKSENNRIIDTDLGITSETSKDLNMHIAVNYQLQTVDEPVNIGGVMTNKYYTMGIVFDNENDTTTNKYTQRFTNFFNDTNVGEGFIYDESATLYAHKHDDSVTSDEITNAGFTFDTAAYDEYAANPEVATFDKDHRTVSQGFSVENTTTQDEWKLKPTYEEWHELFDNDETTLFGAKNYNPNAHMWVNVPIVENPNDENTMDGFGLTPADDQSRAVTTFFSKAVSSKDILALSSLQLKADGKFTTYPTGSPKTQYYTYDLTFGTTAIQYNFWWAEDARWEGVVENHMLNLSYPTPEFEITPLGYNERNQFEVDVKYDHVATDVDFDIVEEVEYKMMGPERKDSPADEEKVLWDEIIINDKGVTRNHRKSINDPTIVQDTYLFTDSDLPDEYQKWTDGDLNNGGQVDKEGNKVPGEAEQIFADFVSLDGSTGYDGDMELEQVNSTIVYDGLFYGDDAEVGKDYEFSSQITLAPTKLGVDNSFLVDSDGTYTTLPGEKFIYTILPGYSTPIINHFEITRPENLDEIDPAGTFTIKYAGDSKSVTEDLGVGLRPSYLNKLQVVAVEVDSEGNVIGEANEDGEIVGEEIALTGLFDPENYVEENGAFSGEITTNDDVALKPLSHYRISLKSYYGNKEMPVDPTGDITTIVENYTLDGEYIIISTDDLGDKQINITNNRVVVNEDNSVTITFDYAVSIPTGMEAIADLDDFQNPIISSVEVVNHLGESNEEVVDTIDFTGFDSSVDQPDITVNLGADKFTPNKTYDLSIRIKTAHDAISVSPAVDGDEFTTPATGPFVPVVGMLAPINTVDTVGGVKTDFEFELEQQLGDGIDAVETSASNISNISLVINDGVNDIVKEDSIAIPSEDKSTILISDTTNVYNTVTEYDYTITVDYEGDEQVVKEGKISFELNGYSELEKEDVVITDISSTMTSLYLETEINDVEIAPGYDSYFVNNVEIVDADKNHVDAKIVWYDETGNVIDAPVDSEEGVEFSGKFSAQLFNIAPGTDLSTYQIHINTNSLNEAEDDDTIFETNYYFNIFELASEVGLLDVAGNFVNSVDIDKEFMDVEPIEVSGFDPEAVVATENEVTFQLTFNDKMDVLEHDRIILFDNNGVQYSMSNENLEVTYVGSNTRTAGMKTYELTMSGLTAGTEYSDFKMSYEISENLGTEEEPIISTSSYTVELTGVSFKTADKPEDKSFPWWIIVLLLLTLIGALVVLALLFLRSVRVISTTKTTNGSVTFVVNRDRQSGFLDKINGAKLQATQNGNVSNVAYSTSINTDGKVAITLSGIRNGDPIKGLKFILDNSAIEATNARINEANKSLEEKYNRENEAYQAVLKTWEENKAKATEAGNEFTETKPAAPAKPSLEKLAKPNKDIKVIGSVKTSLEVSSNNEEPKKPVVEEKPTTEKPAESNVEESKRSTTGSAEIIY